jgi:hypothetical protein
MRPTHLVLREQIAAMAAEAGGCAAPTFAAFVTQQLARPPAAGAPSAQ